MNVKTINSRENHRKTHGILDALVCPERGDGIGHACIDGRGVDALLHEELGLVLQLRGNLQRSAGTGAEQRNIMRCKGYISPAMRPKRARKKKQTPDSYSQTPEYQAGFRKHRLAVEHLVRVRI